MSNTSHAEMIPISSLNALEYCPRKFYYQFVQGEMLVNEFVLEGMLDHERVHQEGTHTMAEGEMQITRLYLYSEALRLTGFADVIEERAGVLVPVEYKHGQQGQWLNDHIQLCAQALCLEERQPGKPLIAYGYIYYVGSRRRVQVHFTQQLRARTKAAIAQALQVAALETPPPPLSGALVARCPNCSLLPLCLPEEVRLLRSKKLAGRG
jgi:CRISPR-associated exonuclease Cas4